MGQVQRRAQQEVELWEFYEENNRSNRKRSPNRGEEREDGRHSRNRAVDREDRRYGLKEGVREGGARRENRGSGGAVRERTRSSVRRTENNKNPKRVERPRMDKNPSRGRKIDLYEIEREPMQENRARRATARRPSNTQRQRENMSRSGGRTGDASQISYLQPYPVAVQRQKQAERGYRGNARPVQSIRRRRARRRREFLCKAAIVFLMVMCLVLIYFITGEIYQMIHRDTARQAVPVITDKKISDRQSSDNKIAPPEMMQDFLEINEYSRPGTRLDRINSIFVHYTANPGTSAAQNRSYFANLAETHERSASAHLIIGYEGELIQCIPFEEQAYAVMTRNEDSISIECCYLEENGSFTQETYDTLIHTLAWLLEEYDLSTEDILRHYDCGGKLCPLYYAENEGAWHQLLQDVAAYMTSAE